MGTEKPQTTLAEAKTECWGLDFAKFLAGISWHAEAYVQSLDRLSKIKNTKG
jgi:hypothetical protein